MNSYHGIIINISQKDKSVLNGLDVIGKKSIINGILALLKVNVDSGNIDNVIKLLQNNMRDHYYWFIKAFYFHFYRDDELIIGFKNKIFHVTPDPSTWNEAVEYGLKIGISKNQLDFFPCRISDEKY